MDKLLDVINSLYSLLTFNHPELPVDIYASIFIASSLVAVISVGFTSGMEREDPRRSARIKWTRLLVTLVAFCLLMWYYISQKASGHTDSLLRMKFYLLSGATVLLFGYLQYRLEAKVKRHIRQHKHL